MKVKELKKYLDDIPDDKEILMSGDPEGNDIRTLDEVAYIKNGDGNNHYIIYPTDTIIDIF